MALVVAGGRSTLNPNAPLYIPAAVRQVEDFSPEWWQLVTTSTWFHDYWLNQQEGDDDDDDDLEDIAGMLPDTIDLEDDEDFLNMEAQFEQFIQSSEAEAIHEYRLSAHKGMSEEELAKSLGLSNSFNERVPKSPVRGSATMYWGKQPSKTFSPKSSYSRVQQPR